MRKINIFVIVTLTLLFLVPIAYGTWWDDFVNSFTFGAIITPSGCGTNQACITCLNTKVCRTLNGNSYTAPQEWANNLCGLRPNNYWSQCAYGCTNGVCNGDGTPECTTASNCGSSFCEDSTTKAWWTCESNNCILNGEPCADSKGAGSTCSGNGVCSTPTLCPPNWYECVNGKINKCTNNQWTLYQSCESGICLYDPDQTFASPSGLCEPKNTTPQDCPGYGLINGQEKCSGTQKLKCENGLIKIVGTCCTPSCSGKECGSDGCSGSCGSCTSGSCNSNGQCVSDSTCGSTCDCTAAHTGWDNTGKKNCYIPGDSCFCPPANCTPTSWTPDPSTKCGSFTQTSNCGTTRTATGIKTEGCDTPPPGTCIEEEDSFYSKGFMTNNEWSLFGGTKSTTGKAEDNVGLFKTILPNIVATYYTDRNKACCANLTPIYSEQSTGIIDESSFSWGNFVAGVSLGAANGMVFGAAIGSPLLIAGTVVGGTGGLIVGAVNGAIVGALIKDTQKIDYKYSIYVCKPKGTSSGFCMPQATEWIGKYTNSTDCSTNTIILVVGGIFAAFIFFGLLSTMRGR